MIYCERLKAHGPDVPATRYVHLSSRFVSITRAFCDDCARELCTPKPAGELQGADVGAVTHSPN